MTTSPDVPETGRAPISSLRQIVVNAGTLLRGGVIGAIFGLATATVAARYLGVEAFGVLALAQTYAMTVQSLANVQSVQALIKFGVAAQEDGARARFASVVRSGANLDAATAAGGTVLALAGIGLGAVIWGWSSDVVVVAVVFAVAILTHVTDAPTAILRIFDRFDLLARHAMVLGAVRFAAVGLTLLFGGRLVAAAIVWVLVDVAGNLLVIWWSLAELRRQGRLDEVRRAAPLDGTTWRSFRSFVVSTHLHSSLRVATKSADVLVVGALAGPGPAGVYRLAKQLASIPGRLTDPLYYAVYPELSRLWARRAHAGFRHVVGRMAVYGALAGLVAVVGFALLGGWLVDALIGGGFDTIYPTTLLLLVGVNLALAGLPLQPAMLAMGRARASMFALSASTTIYLVALVALTASFEAVGAAAAYIVFYVAWAIVLVVLVRRSARDEIPEELET